MVTNIKVTLSGNLFDGNMTRQVVGIITDEITKIADETNDRAIQRWRGVKSGRLLSVMQSGSASKSRDLVGEYRVSPGETEDYRHRVEHGNRRTGFKGYRTYKNAAKWMRTQIRRHDRIGERIASRLNG